MKSWIKKLILMIVIIVAILGAIAWYLFNEKFTDTTKRDAAFNIDAQSFIKEFQQNDSLANIKYKEKIITVNGTVSEIETMDSIINIKMIDTTTDAYVIFGFQNEQIAKVKTIKEGDKISVKGSCSGGSYSDILEVEAIDFKRCVINN
jgi:Tfp pilus assembly protein PilV